MSQNMANRLANAVSGKKRIEQMRSYDEAASAPTAEAPKVEFFKHDPNRQKAYAEGRKRLDTEANKRRY